jgi:hypothetical protein
MKYSAACVVDENIQTSEFLISASEQIPHRFAVTYIGSVSGYFTLRVCPA